VIPVGSDCVWTSTMPVVTNNQIIIPELDMKDGLCSIDQTTRVFFLLFLFVPFFVFVFFIKFLFFICYLFFLFIILYFL
jgi:hypothetical protein